MYETLYGVFVSICYIIIKPFIGHIELQYLRPVARDLITSLFRTVMPRFMRQPFDALAVELVELILCNLDGATILRASRVYRALSRVLALTDPQISRRFRNLIAASAQLQYRTELALEGLIEDALYPQEALLQRIAALGVYKRCWNELRVPDTTATFRSTEDDYFLPWYPAGRWLVDQTVEQTTMRIAELESAPNELQWHEMALDSADDSPRRNYSTIALHGLNMLIVVGVAKRIDSQSVPRVHYCNSRP